jgi:DNA-binding SARP family transcriptional activator
VGLRVALFGSIEVIGARRTLRSADFPSRKARHVCALLALAGGRPVSKSQLIDTLWGERLPRDPGATVEQAVSVLRSALSSVSDAPHIVTEQGRYRFDTDHVVIDVVHLESLLALAAQSSGRERLDTLHRALAEARGDLLADETEPWAADARDRYRRLTEDAALDLARLALAHDEPAVAHEAASRAWHLSPIVLEEAYAADVASLAAMGRVHEARTVMHELERRLADEEGAEPSPASRALQELLRHPAQLRPAGTPITTVVGRPPGRRRTVPFIGRETVLHTVAQAVDSAAHGPSRLVLLEGASGVGKSRALRAAHDEATRRGTVRAAWFACTASDAEHHLLAAARLLRALATVARRRISADVGDSVTAMLGRMADVLDDLAPTAVFVDDLHLADPATADLLSSLTDQGGVRSLCIVASRSLTGPGTERRPLGATTTVRIGSLDRRSVDALDIPLAWEETGGHPATLAACVDAARSGGVLSPDGAAAVLARIRQLDQIGRLVLRQLASTSRPDELTAVAADLGLSRSMVERAVERAVDLGLLRAGRRGRIEFTGGVIQRAATDPALAIA